jgi:hypothetical protein
MNRIYRFLLRISVKFDGSSRSKCFDFFDLVADPGRKAPSLSLCLRELVDYLSIC